MRYTACHSVADAVVGCRSDGRNITFFESARLVATASGRQQVSALSALSALPTDLYSPAPPAAFTPPAPLASPSAAGANPRRRVFSVIVRGTTNCNR